MKNILILIQVTINICNIAYILATTTSTTSNPNDPCSFARILDARERLYSVPGNRRGCDITLAEDWYKFEINGSPAQIPQQCMKNNACGTQLPLHLDLDGNSLPAIGDELDAHVCTSYNVLGKWDCCVLRQSVKIKNCGGVFVYYLKGTDRCPVAYCAQGAGDMPSDELTIKRGDVYDETPSNTANVLTTGQETSLSPSTEVTTTISLSESLNSSTTSLSPQDSEQTTVESAVTESHSLTSESSLEGSTVQSVTTISNYNQLCRNWDPVPCPNGVYGCFRSPEDNSTVIPCSNGFGCGIVCDNVNDCRDESDESRHICATNNLCAGFLPSTTCPNGNPGCYRSPIDNTTVMPCANGRGCGVVCDNMPDCRDGSDEDMCDHTLCAEGRQKCSNSRGCFTRCNGIEECVNPGANEDEMGCSTSSISATTNPTDADEDNRTTRPTTNATPAALSPTSVIPTNFTSEISTTDDSTMMDESVQVQNTTTDPSLVERTTSSQTEHVITTSNVVVDSSGTTVGALNITDTITTEPEDFVSNDTSQNAFSQTDITSAEATTDQYTQANTGNETMASASSVPFTSLSPENTMSTGINTSTTAYKSFNDTSQTETSELANVTSVSFTKSASELSTDFTEPTHTNTTDTVTLLTSSTDTFSETQQQTDSTYSQVTEFQSTVSTNVFSVGITTFESVTSGGNNVTTSTTSQSSSVQSSTNTTPSDISSTLETSSHAATSSEPATTSSHVTTSSERVTTSSHATTSSERATTSSHATTSSERATTASYATTSSERSTSRPSTSSTVAAITSSTETLLLNTSTSVGGTVYTTMSISSDITEITAKSFVSATSQEANITVLPAETSSVKESWPTTTVDNQTSPDNGTTVLTVTVEEKASLFYENFGLFVFLIVASAVLAGIGIFGIIGCIYQRRLRTWKPSMAYQDAYLAFDKSKYPFRHGIESPIPDFDILRDEKLMKEEETSLSQASTLALASTPVKVSAPLDDTYGAETEVRTPSAIGEQANNEISYVANGHTNEAFVADETVNIAEDSIDGIVPVDELDKSPPRTLFPWIENAEDTKL